MAKKTKAEPLGAGGIKGVDLAEVERLLAFMQKHGLEEFEYERAGVHVRLKKASLHGGVAARTVQVVESAALPEAHAPVPAPAAKTSGDTHVIKSPIVGTFYSAPSPGADPFVTRGAKIDVGQVLCIIEAMKLMNEIESDVAGEIVDVFVENGSPVEYGQALFGIRPHKKK
ncbi:MAG TPA: acetyl-CoA carboxylase biotin carboxyl carrier protein [Verrucomicrobiae bacterium]|nr:acetyl-CoA carboxylase biotin carboxyl carrier protein [Verrucomicrobiae bacterium]